MTDIKVIELPTGDGEIEYQHYYDRLRRLVSDGLMLWGEVEMIGMLELAKHHLIMELTEEIDEDVAE